MSELPFAIPLADQIAAVKREIMLRQGTYPRWVERKKMKPETAEREIARMKAVLATLEMVATVAAAKKENMR